MKPINIAQVDTLARILGKDIQFLQSIALHIDNYYIEDLTDKKSGELRILHKPRYTLKIIQKNIKKVLVGIPLPDCVHGWVRGKSVKSAVEPHRGMKYLYCFDIRSYFDTVHSKRVYILFTKKLKCAPEPAQLLTRLSTYKASLPQGSPCSPFIANLLLFDFDVSMNVYAKRRNAKYSRLGDDILLSSNYKLDDAVHVVVSGLCRYGLKINKDKTNFGTPLKSGVKVLGIVIGSGVTVSSKYRRELEAILHNAQKTGLNLQNREGRFDMRKHLFGRITLIELYQPEYGAQLRNKLKIIQN